MGKEYTLEETRDAFADKQFDERALEFIHNFMNEFDSLFGKYLPREEVVRRIKENLNDVKFDSDFGKDTAMGKYNLATGCVMISEKLQDIEMIKSVFFHEMIHCLTLDRENGFVGFIQTDDYYDYTDESEENVIGVGFSEGVTEYINWIRAQKYNPEYSRNSYPILSEQIQNLSELIGEDVLLEMTFNAPNQLADKLGIEDWEMQSFLESFDVIWQEEKNLYLDQRDEDIALLKSLLGIKDSRQIHSAKTTIINVYEQLLLSKPIETVDEFNKMYRKISQYTQQLGKEPDVEMPANIISKMQEIVQSTNQGLSEVVAELDEEPRLLLQRTLLLRQFREASNEEKLELLSNKEFKKMVYDAGGNVNMPGLRAALAVNVLEVQSEDAGIDLYMMLTSGLAQIIKDKKYNIDRLGIEKIDFDEGGVSVYNLYYADIEDSEYVGTYSLNEDLDLVEFSLNVPKETKQEILRAHPEFAESILLQSQTGEILANHEDGQYTRIDEHGYEYDGYPDAYYQSRLEYLQSRLKFFTKNIKPGGSRMFLERPKQYFAQIEQILFGTTKEDKQIESSARGTITQADIDELCKYIKVDSSVPIQEERKKGTTEDWEF